MGLLTAIREFFGTPRIWIRGGDVASLPDLVDLIDRFLDDKLVVDHEWDDFVSWENANPGIEEIRQRVADLERDFLTSREDVRQSATRRLVLIRNEVAAIIGMPRRD